MCGLNTKLNRLCNSKHLVENSNIKQREKTVLYFIFSLNFVRILFILNILRYSIKTKRGLNAKGKS